MTGRIEGLALVVGSAGCVFDDLAPFKDVPATIIAVNAMITAYPGDIQIGVTLHSEFTPHYAWMRNQRQTTPWVFYANASNDGMHHVLQPRWVGTSALYGVQIAEMLGASRIVVAGVPLDESQKFDGQASCLQPWLDQYRENWIEAKGQFLVPVHSMSGWTRELLGPPPADWFQPGTP